MGQQAVLGRSRDACEGPTDHQLAEEAKRLADLLQKCDRLQGDPEVLQRECDFHFNRAGLDASGCMRRVELRRLLWTFAQQLGSSELTWELIEASAVVGTLEAHVPIVQRDEFFRCVLKTVHLVAAELRRKLAELEEFARHLREEAEEVEQRAKREQAHAASTCEAPPVDMPASPWARAAAMAESRRRQMGGSSSSASEADPNEEDRGDCEHSSGALFRKAPGAHVDDAAPVNGMIAMVLSADGSFEPQRILVGRGTLVLSDPESVAPTFAQRLLCADGRTAFDLTLLHSSVRGEDVLRVPGAALLPPYARGRESLDRVLMLSFASGDALCLWFNAPEDCELCWEAVRAEANSLPGLEGCNSP